MPKPTTGRGRGGDGRKTLEQRRLTGNAGKRALPPAPTPGTALEVVAPGTIPDAPDSLGDVGRRLWYTLWQAGSQHLAPLADGPLVVKLCEQWEDAARLREWLGGDVERRWYVTAAGQIVSHPAVKQIEQINAQCTAWLSMLGFTPSDRARLGLAEVRVADALDEFRRKREARTGS